MEASGKLPYFLVIPILPWSQHFRVQELRGTAKNNLEVTLMNSNVKENNFSTILNSFYNVNN